MSKKKVYVVGEGRGGPYGAMFIGQGWEIANDINDADLVQFTGGSDVTPSLYGETKHHTTWNDPNRDEYEQSIYKLAIALGLPCAGICRGGQFLNVMNGGKLYQDVDGHANGPHIATVIAPIMASMVTSTHHQMMRPTKDAIILMTARQSMRKEYMDGDLIMTDRGGDDIESVYYPATNTLCFQPHPEFNNFAALECREVYFFFINNYLMGEGEGNVGSGPRDLIDDCGEYVCAV